MLFKMTSNKQNVQCEWVFFTGTIKWNKKTGLDSNNHLNNTAKKIFIAYIHIHQYIVII